MRKETSEFKKIFFLVFIVSLVLYALNIVSSYFGKSLIGFIQFLDLNNIIKLSLITLSLFLLSLILSYISGISQAKLGNDIKIKMQKQFYRIIQDSEYAFTKKTSSGEIYYRMFRDIGNIVDFFISLVLNVPINIIICVVSLILMFIIYAKLAFILIAFSILHSLFIHFFKKPLKKIARAKVETEQQLIRRVNEDFLLIEINQSLGLEDYFLGNINKYFSNYRTNNLKLVSFSFLSNSLIGIIGQAVNLVALFLGVFYISKGEMILGDLFLIFIFTGYFSKSLSAIFSIYTSFHITNVSFVRYNESLKYYDTMRKQYGFDFNFINEIFVNNINFSYGDKIVFNNFSCKIPANKITLLKGDNGSGKSTLLKILRRLLYVDSGGVFIDGMNIYEISYAEYKNHVCLLPSKDYIFEETIKFNICLDKKYTNEELDNIIKICRLDNIIEKSGNGLDEMIGLGYKNLSDGEIKKISLARVLIMKPKILLLDEPTVHIDDGASQEIIDILQKYQKDNNITIIISSHDDRVTNISDNIIMI